MSQLGELRRTLRADYAANDGSWPPKVSLAVWRFGQAAHGRPGLLAFVQRRLHGLFDALWTRTVIGAELPRSVQAGAGLRLPHGGRGVILHPHVVIGSGVTLYHQVTVGVRKGDTPPRIEDRAYIGAGSKLIGPIVIGAGSSVGANAVVLHDVPPGETWVGIPARCIKRSAGP